MIRLGVTLPQFTADPLRVIEGARIAENLELDSIWAFDHLWPLTGGKDRPIFEAWTTLAFVAARTHRVALGSLVTRSTLRHPAVLGKIAATVAEVAPGRLRVAVGSGDELSRAENEAFGIPYCGGEDRVPQMLAVLETLRAMCTSSEATSETAYHSVTALPVSPRPVTPPPLWAGGRSDEVLVAAGGWCDGWNSWAASPRRFEREAARVRAAAGDRPVELTWGGQVIIGRDDDDARERLGTRSPKAFVVGGPERVAERFRALGAAGAEHIICAFPFAGPEQYELLAGPVRHLLT